MSKQNIFTTTTTKNLPEQAIIKPPTSCLPNEYNDDNKRGQITIYTNIPQNFHVNIPQFTFVTLLSLSLTHGYTRALTETHTVLSYTTKNILFQCSEHTTQYLNFISLNIQCTQDLVQDFKLTNWIKFYYY